LARAHIGKQLTVTDAIYDISSVGRGRLFILLNGSDPHVTLNFEEKWAEPISALSKNNEITVTGKIKSIGRNSVDLDQCELVKF
jgi:hypothetical protein